MNELVIYHANCLDGLGAAYAAYTVFGENAKYVPAHYGNEPPDVAGKDVTIVDFSYPREVLIEMYNKANSILVIDHHKTAQDSLADLEFAKFDMSQSGAVLAWRYFQPLLPVPQALRFIQDRDLWEFELEDTKAFCAGVHQYLNGDFRKLDMSDENVKTIIQNGQTLLAEFNNNVTNLEKQKHEVTLLGIKGLAVNANSMFASELGNRLAKESKTFGLVYSYSGESKRWIYSLRSIGDFDVSEIAKTFRGGGHKNAAGFNSSELFGF